MCTHFDTVRPREATPRTRSTVAKDGRDLIDHGATARIAAYVAARSTLSLPDAIAESARRAFVNWMGCALGGAHDPSVEQVLAVASRLSGRNDASVVGRSAALDAVNAALVNGVAANALDYDDMHAPTLIHPTGPVVAAALALAEARSAPGRALLCATVIGIEVECGIGAALFPAHYDAGWHITATVGTFGATAAACSVLGLDESRIRHALGIASTLAGGLRAMLTSPCKSLNIGKAASSGVTAALLAEAGFESDPTALEAKFGFFHVFGQPKSAPTFEPADRSAVAETSLKPYPCGVVIHPLIDACIALADAHELSLERVESVAIAMHPRALELSDRQHPATKIEGRYSLQHAAALALTRGRAGLADFDEANVDDPGLKAWRARMLVTADETLSPAQARVVVTRRNGTHVTHQVDHPSGSPQRPLTDQQLEGKFVELAQRALDPGAAERLYRDCRRVDTLPEVNALRRHWAAEAVSA